MSKLPTSRLPVTPKNVNPVKSGLRPPQSASSAAPPSQQASPTGADSSASNQFSVGDRVNVGGKAGAVAYIGPTKFADGEWFGIILDELQGKNDGSYEGTRYFETEPNRGLFCRAAKIQRLAQNGANNSGDTIQVAKASTTPSTDISKSSTSVSTPGKGDDADTTIINTSVVDTSVSVNDQTLSSEQPSLSSPELRVGDRVVVSGSKFGTLKYLGKIHVAEGVWCGIQLDEPLGKNDGSVSGKRYFTCQQRYGLFSPLARVEKVTNEAAQAQAIARKASVSSTANNNAQLQRSTSQESLHSNLSEISASSNSISRLPTRTPVKSQQQKASMGTNVYGTGNTKSLLTQAAATLAAVTPSSNQVANLVQALKDKDIFIEKLQSQREQDRLEFSRAAQQVDEMESRLISFKQQYEVKVAETEELKKEQYLSTQRIEDLEFQLEEYKLNDANKENTSTPTVPFGYRLLSPDEIEIYDTIKAKLVELESANQKLVLERQTSQDEHQRLLKQQMELAESDLKARLNELRQKYDDDLKSSLTSQNDTIKSEYEAKLTDTERQMRDLMEQIKNEKQQEIDQLTSRISELHEKDQMKTSTLSEKETYYEQQIKEQQFKSEQSTNELQEVRSQLTTLQQENEANVKQVNSLLEELTKYRENLVPDLKKQNQELLADLQRQEQTVKDSISERENLHQQDIQAGEMRYRTAESELEKIRNELKQIQEENQLKEQQTTELVDTLKQEREKLHKEFNDLTAQEQQLRATLNERESHYEQATKDYQEKLSQATGDYHNVQSEFEKVQEEKIVNEKKYNDTISTLKQDYERQYEALKTELTDLQDRDRTQNMALSEREAHYEEQIKEYQTKRDQTTREMQDLRDELTKLQEEKSSIEKRLNEAFDHLQQDSEKQIESLKSDIAQLENQNQVKANEFNEKDEQLNAYQSKCTQLENENKALLEQIEQIRRDNDTKIEQIQKELEEKHQTNQQTHNEHVQRTETLTKDYEELKLNHESLQKTFQDIENKYHNLQNECEQHSQTQERLRSTNDNLVNEKQALIDQLSQQINDMQEAQLKLVEKQIDQQTQFERERSEDKTYHEKLMKEKTEEFDAKLQTMKSEYLLEQENSKLEHEQEKLVLKSQLNQVLQNVDNKNSSNTSNNVRQLEYELSDARYQIEKLQKQIEAFSTKDDRSVLEGQINFLNDVIVDLRNTNERLQKELEFQKNPFAGDDEFAQTTSTETRRSGALRLYCDMCEVFDQHDTDDCPKQNSYVDDQASLEHHERVKSQQPPRLYCEKCEQFDHDCNEADETY